MELIYKNLFSFLSFVASGKHIDLVNKDLALSFIQHPSWYWWVHVEFQRRQFLTVWGEQTSSSFQITITDSTLTPACTAQRPFDVEVSLGFSIEHFPSFISTTAGILKQTPRKLFLAGFLNLWVQIWCNNIYMTDVLYKSALCPAWYKIWVRGDDCYHAHKSSRHICSICPHSSASVAL